MADQPQFVPVILAGGSGTRFWPRSRKARAKQVLALAGPETMIQQTVARLSSLADAKDFLILTNNLLVDTIAQQLPTVPRERLLCEPFARNTAPACGLAAMIVERTNPGAVLGIFPSDAVVQDEARFTDVVRAAVAVAAAGDNVVVLGAPPNRPETGYGYIEEGASANEFPASSASASPIPVKRVSRFTEKPDHARAEQFLAAGNYSWNAGIFLWRADTLAKAIREHMPAIAAPLERIAAAFGTPEFDSVLAHEFAEIESISIDYAVLEPRSAKGDAGRIFCLPADFGWNDLGSWTALHEHLSADSDAGTQSDGNVIEAAHSLVLDATGNYVFAPGKAVALLGVSDLVIVQTDDALLITTRAHSQQVGRVVEGWKKADRTELI